MSYRNILCNSKDFLLFVKPDVSKLFLTKEDSLYEILILSPVVFLQNNMVLTYLSQNIAIITRFGRTRFLLINIDKQQLHFTHRRRKTISIGNNRKGTVTGNFYPLMGQWRDKRTEGRGVKEENNGQPNDSPIKQLATHSTNVGGGGKEDGACGR